MENQHKPHSLSSYGSTGLNSKCLYSAQSSNNVGGDYLAQYMQNIYLVVFSETDQTCSRGGNIDKNQSYNSAIINPYFPETYQLVKQPNYGELDYQGIQSKITEGFSAYSRGGDELTFIEKEEVYPFFESASKYISLKNFKAKYTGATSLLTQTDQSKSIFDQEVIEKGLSIKMWFERLSLPDKGIVLTIIDKQLVKLICKMYKYVAKYGHGKFSNQRYPEIREQCVSMQEMNLYFIKPKIQKFQTSSQTIQEKLSAEDTIIQSIRVFSSTNNDENIDSITLDLDLYNHFIYFSNMIKKAQVDNFLIKEYSIFEDPKRLKNNVFHDPEDSKLPNYYVTVAPPDQDVTEISLGQCLIQLFEKAINVNYLDYQSKFGKAQANYLFIEPKWQKFQYDRSLAQFWHKQLSYEQKNQIFMKLNEIKEEIIMEDHLRAQANQINEESDEETQVEEQCDLELGYSGYSGKSGYLNSNIQAIMDDRDDVDGSFDRMYEAQKSKQAKYTTYGVFGKTQMISNHRDCLMSSLTNNLHKSKTDLLQQAHDTQNELKVFTFINSISFSQTLESLRRKSEHAIVPLQALRQKFYEFLLKEKKIIEDAYIDDLIKEDEQPKKPPKKQSSITSNGSTHVINANTANLQTQNTLTHSAKKNKKKKNKKKNAAAVIQQEEQPSPSKILHMSSQDDVQQEPKINAQMNSQEIAQVIRQMHLSPTDGPIKCKFEEEQTYEQRKKEERTSLLTGEYIENKYPDDLDELLSSSKKQQETSQPTNTSSKKKKKNKKNKNKNKEQQQQQNQLSEPLKEEPLQYQPVQLSIFQEDLDMNYTSNQGDIKVEKLLQILSNNQPQNQKPIILDESEDLEKIEIDQIALEVKMPANHSKDKKINNFLLNSQKVFYQDQAEVKDYQLEVKLCEKQDEEEENATRKMVESLTQNICKQAILSQEDLQKKESSLQSKKRPTASSEPKNKKKKNKKSKNKNNNQRTGVNEQVVVVQQQKQEEQVLEKQQKPKKVGFRLARDARGEGEEDLVAVPKRGSSRGSSGNEEVVHNNTINMLGELFPSEYKNPSDVVKTTMSEIKSNSNSPAQQVNQDQTHPPTRNSKPQIKQNNSHIEQQSNETYSKKQYTNEDSYHHHKGAQTNNAQQKKPQYVKKQLQSSEHHEDHKPQVNHTTKPSETKTHSEESKLKNQAPSKSKATQKVTTHQHQHYDNYQSMFTKAYGAQGTTTTPENLDNNQPLVENSKAKPKPRENIKEQGVFVNPETLKQMSKKQKKERQPQNTQIIHMDQPAKHFIVEHRSITPNVETQVLDPSANYKSKPYKNSKPLANQPYKVPGTKRNSKGKYSQNADSIIAFDKMNQPTSQIPPAYQFQQGFNPYHIQSSLPVQHQQMIYPMMGQSLQHNIPPQNSLHVNGQMIPPYYPPQYMQQFSPSYNLGENEYHQQQQQQQPSQTRNSPQPTINEENQTQAKQGSQEDRKTQPNTINQMFSNQFPPLMNMPPFQQQQFSTPPFNTNPMQPVYLAPQILNQSPFRVAGLDMPPYPYQNHYNPQFPPQNQAFIVPPYNHQNSIPTQLNILTQLLQNQNYFMNQQFLSQQYMNQNNFHSNGYMPMHNHQVPYQDPVESDFYQTLENEIVSLSLHLKQKLKQNEQERNKAFGLLKELITQTYSGMFLIYETIHIESSDKVQVNMYGSMATGLAIDSSDMDILVTGLFKQSDNIQRSQLIQAMNLLYQTLDSLFCIASNSLIDTANIPVIKLKLDLMKIREKYDEENKEALDESMQYLKIDITFNDQESDQYDLQKNGTGVHLGIKCCQYIMNLLEEYPIIEPIILVLKKFLAIKDLNSPFLGGLSSYGLILLIVALLKTDSPQLYSNSSFDPPSYSLVQTFSYFLFFYGYNFDPSQQIINEDTYIVEATQNLAVPTACLTILDPLNPINNIGKSTYNFAYIKMEFARAYDRLMNKLNKVKQQKSMMNPVEGEVKELTDILHILDEVLEINIIGRLNEKGSDQVDEMKGK